MRVLASALVAAFLILQPSSHGGSLSTTAVAASQLPMYSTEAAAQGHCPRDVVVWANVRTGVYHEKGMRYFGRTKNGAYVCRREADAAGYRNTRNGQ